MKKRKLENIISCPKCGQGITPGQCPQCDDIEVAEKELATLDANPTVETPATIAGVRGNR